MDKRRLRFALGTDHAGFAYKEVIKEHLEANGFAVEDFGTFSAEPCDYPDFIHPAAAAVASGRCTHGIVFGGSGNGEAIVSNKVRGIRCCVVHSPETAIWAKSHNNANMIAIGERTMSPDEAIQCVKLWLATDFEGGRHARRVEKVTVLDQKREMNPGV